MGAILYTRLGVNYFEAACYDVACELPEGQDMILEFSKITAPLVKHEGDEAVDAIFDSEEVSAVQNVTQSEGCLLKPIF